MERTPQRSTISSINATTGTIMETMLILEEVPLLVAVVEGGLADGVGPGFELGLALRSGSGETPT